MLTPISTKIEEFEEKIEYVEQFPFGIELTEMNYLLKQNQDKHLYRTSCWPESQFELDEKKVKDFISTALQQRDKEWREMAELSKKKGNKHHPGCLNNDCPGYCDCLTWSQNKGYNQALNDIITKSKEI